MASSLCGIYGVDASKSKLARSDTKSFTLRQDSTDHFHACAWISLSRIRDIQRPGTASLASKSPLSAYQVKTDNSVEDIHLKFSLATWSLQESCSVLNNCDSSHDMTKFVVICTYSTMFGCLMPLRREISRMAVDGTPSSSFSSLIFLSATNSPVFVSRHLYTTPYVPSPSFSSLSYRSSCDASTQSFFYLSAS